MTHISAYKEYISVIEGTAPPSSSKHLTLPTSLHLFCQTGCRQCSILQTEQREVGRVKCLQDEWGASPSITDIYSLTENVLSFEGQNYLTTRGLEGERSFCVTCNCTSNTSGMDLNLLKCYSTEIPLRLQKYVHCTVHRLTQYGIFLSFNTVFKQLKFMQICLHSAVTKLYKIESHFLVVSFLCPSLKKTSCTPLKHTVLNHCIKYLFLIKGQI